MAIPHDANADRSTSTGNDRPAALTLAGSDSGGGAGLQADLKTFAACEVFGTSVVTLITAQNTRGVAGVEPLPEPVIRAQFNAIVPDLEPAAAKTGALGNESVIETVADCLDAASVGPVVVDPVMISKHGDALMADSAQTLIRDRLLPTATLVTPNRHEAQALCDQTVSNVDSMKEAARRIYDFGPDNVLIKGAHLDAIVRDIFFDGSGFIEFGADRVDSDRLHGSGCVHSSAITARLARGDALTDAIAFARDFITRAIAQAPKIGHGIAPVNPMFAHWK